VNAVPYHIKIAPKAFQQILTLATKQQKPLIKLVEALAVNPRPPGAKKIEGLNGLYCEEVEGVRVIYKVEDLEILILLVN
jgi:mRNA interferase RelE/StbE